MNCIEIQGFWQSEKRSAQKAQHDIAYHCDATMVSGAHALTSLYLWPYHISVHYVAGPRSGDSAEGQLYHVTKNPNNTGEISVAFTPLAKNQWNFRGVSTNQWYNLRYII